MYLGSHTFCCQSVWHSATRFLPSPPCGTLRAEQTQTRNTPQHVSPVPIVPPPPRGKLTAEQTQIRNTPQRVSPVPIVPPSPCGKLGTPPHDRANTKVFWVLFYKKVPHWKKSGSSSLVQRATSRSSRERSGAARPSALTRGLSLSPLALARQLGLDSVTAGLFYHISAACQAWSAKKPPPALPSGGRNDLPKIRSPPQCRSSST